MTMFISLFVSTLLAGAPIPASGKLPDPIATIQFAPIEVLEKDVFRFVQSLPFPEKDKIVQEMKDGLKKALGDSGWDGLDIKKPGTGYLVFDEKNPDKSYGFIVAPVTDEKKFIELFKRIGQAGDSKNHLEEVKGNPGLYKLVGKNDDEPKHLRVHNGYAYLGINAPLEAFAADKLVPPEKTLNPKETAKIAVTVLAERLPKEWTQKGLEEFQSKARQGIEQMPNLTKEFKNILNQGINLVPKYAKQIQSEGDSFGFRVQYEDAIKYELFLKGKPGTTLAKDIAERKPTTNRFAGILNDKTVAGFQFKLPFLNEDLRGLSSKGLEEYYKDLCEKDPPPADLKQLLDQVVPRLSTTIKSGDFDLSGALNGPNAKSTYTAVLGIALDDAVGITPVLKEVLDKQAGGMIEWDTHESEGMKIHTINVVPLIPADIKKVIGNNATCQFALTKSGVFLTLGQDAIPEIKRAMALKPSPASVLDVKVNAVKLSKIVEGFNPMAAQQMSTFVGNQNKLLSIYSLNVKGGSELTIDLDLGYTLFAGFVWTGMRAAP
ncbi:MAG: hypothetical protein U0798_04295 [Gemmataceae bacterium]